MSFIVHHSVQTLMTGYNTITIHYTEDGIRQEKRFTPDLYEGFDDAGRQHAAQLWINAKYREHAERPTQTIPAEKQDSTTG